MTKKTIERYALVRAQITALEEEESKLADKVLKEMAKEGIEMEQTDYGTFTRVSRKVWTYTEAIKKIAEDQRMYIGAARRTEEENGKATVEEKVNLAFRVKSEK